MKQENLKLNIIFNILSQIVLYITPLVIAPYISRTLGATGVGEYSYAYSIAYYFNIFIIFGFLSYGTKQIASCRNDQIKLNETFWGIIIARTFIFIFITAIYIVAIALDLFGKSVNSAMMVALIPVLLSSLLDVSFLLQGVEKFRIISISQVIVNILYMTLIFVFVKSYNDLILYTVLKSCVGIATAIYQMFYTAKYISKPVLNWNIIAVSFKESFVFFLPTVIMTINPILDQTMLGSLADVKEVAYYQQTYKIISLVNMLVGAIAPVMLSRVSYLYANGDIEECKNKIQQAIHLAYFIIIPSTVGLICISKYFVPAYFGYEFLPAVDVMLVLTISVLFSPVSAIIINSYYYPTHKVKLVTILMAISIGVNLIANVFAIKYLGAVGAALTTTTFAILAHVLCVAFSWKYIDYKNIYLLIWKIVVSAAVMAAMIIFVNVIFSNFGIENCFVITIVDIVSGCFTYGISALILKERLAFNILTEIKNKLLRR